MCIEISLALAIAKMGDTYGGQPLGPIIDPWGIPHFIPLGSDKVPCMFTHCDCPVKYDCSHWFAEPSMPKSVSNRLKSVLYSTVSNAVDMSNNTSSTHFLLSTCCPLHNEDHWQFWLMLFLPCNCFCMHFVVPPVDYYCPNVHLSVSLLFSLLVLKYKRCLKLV